VPRCRRVTAVCQLLAHARQRRAPLVVRSPLVVLSHYSPLFRSGWKTSDERASWACLPCCSWPRLNEQALRLEVQLAQRLQAWPPTSVSGASVELGCAALQAPRVQQRTLALQERLSPGPRARLQTVRLALRAWPLKFGLGVSEVLCSAPLLVIRRQQRR
jgi:hypothetical protein